MKKISSTIRKIRQKLLGDPKYVPARYWKKRHAKFGFDMRGVGNKSYSDEQNRQDYAQAETIVLELCSEYVSNWSSLKVLDIGCGTGFYTEMLQRQGVKNYTGIDISDQLFPELRRRFPDYTFRKTDVTSEDLPDKSYNLVLMIDVTQHIVSEQGFARAMENVRSHLSSNGIFIVTSWLADQTHKRTYYELARSFDCYTEQFEGYKISQPVPFRDKYIFVVSNS
ncbi:dTDP-3-amino-3,4,6-trideoxy-alpha-D-glucopyranose [Anaerohalosphaera lusitana]|uniref:dTDP-3-amino-3,4, 6-trideoxy-alpha-D-glucopyranose n=1 Tax=Anaerohalosphaera lusitana TaxID=1936003 RepID=A0A1U9NKB6_9BACT|nr:class I SAM-dependent methyltransferase [Anaerohalosphaera lusitana]AQT68373.1 dTDP-3-amino-3,4,6-trideoxy-alpha-D-glucopyranose [Anaerohalosphaera lusitana]